MSNDYQQDPDAQNNQNQYGYHQQDVSQHQKDTQQEPASQGTSQPQEGQNADGPLGGARQMAEGQINTVIDQLGNKIPGGSKFTKQAKDAVGGILENLENMAEKRLGGLFGGGQKNDPQQ